MKKQSSEELSSPCLKNLKKELGKNQEAEKYLETEREKLKEEKEKIRNKIKKEKEILKLKKRINRIKNSNL